MSVKLFVATKAFIVRKGSILILRESGSYADGTNAGRWDVPGGRIESGQNFKESLLREIREETGLSARIGKPFYVGEWRPVVRGEEWQIVGIYFECETESNAVQLSADHDAFEWISPKDFRNHSLIPNVNAAFEAYLGLNRTI